MVEITKYTPLKTPMGAFIASCEVRVPAWKMTIREIKVFEKGNQKWVGLPSREYLNKEGEKKYSDTIVFDTEEDKNAFRNSIAKAISAYLDKDSKQEDFPF